MPGSAGQTVILDDDPTGTQELHEVPVLLDWAAEDVAGVRGAETIDIVTNVRSMSAKEAFAVTAEAAGETKRQLPAARLVLRGDSTLRGHPGEEYRAIQEVVFASRPPVLLLVPALPAAGRLTRDGIHWLESGGERVRLDRTEYAHDGVFSYRSARLLDWISERSNGYIATGTELHLDELRAGGPPAVLSAIQNAAGRDGPTACVPDAETIEDLQTIAAALRRAEAHGIEVVARCAPTFAAVLTGALAPGLIPIPRAGEGGVLVVCGSYVGNSTRQLERLSRDLSVDPIELDVDEVLRGREEAEWRRLAANASEELSERRVAVIATPRNRGEGAESLAAGAKVARALARAVGTIDPAPDVVIAKGGVTSHVVFEEGFGLHRATVAGPVARGVAEWRARMDGHELSYLVFPGNVGGEDDLALLVRDVLAE